MVWPNINTRLNTNQVVKNKNEIIENGRSTLSFVFSRFFNIKNPPKADKTKPNSRGWWDQEIKPSIPKTSWESESAYPDTIWISEPISTRIIPFLREFLVEFRSKRIVPIIAAQLVIETPVYTTICCMLQKNSGSFWRWDIASQNPADTTTKGPTTARTETRDRRVLVFARDEFENFWINFILV